MQEKPTYREYSWAQMNGFIRTKDGRYFKAEKSKAAKRIISALNIVSLASLYIFPIWIISKYLFWTNFEMEFILLYFALTYLIGRLDYRLTRFSLVEESSPDFDAAQNAKYRKTIVRTIVLSIAITASIFLLLNSYSVMLIRSVFGQGGEITAAATIPVNSLLESDTIPIDVSPDDKFVEITITRTPEIAKFYLDGQPIPSPDMFTTLQSMWEPSFRTSNVHHSASIQFIWEEEYFYCEYNIWLEDVSDGSVLTLDCGDLHREWTIEAEDKV